MARRVTESLYEELVRVCKRKPKASEPWADFTLAILRKCQKLDDDEWNSLRESTQVWVNEQTTKDNNSEEFALLMPDGEVEEKSAAASKRGVEAADADPGESPPDGDDPKEDAMAKTATAKKTAGTSSKSAAKSKAAGKGKPRTDDEGNRGRKGSFDLGAKIQILTADNPKRVGTAGHDRFAKYRKGMSVDEALKAGVLWADLRYDVAHKFIAIK